MPYQNDLIELCDGITVFRMEGNLIKEYELYNLLIRIYRSPEILLKLTGKILYHWINLEFNIIILIIKFFKKVFYKSLIKNLKKSS